MRRVEEEVVVSGSSMMIAVKEDEFPLVWVELVFVLLNDEMFEVMVLCALVWALKEELVEGTVL